MDGSYSNPMKKKGFKSSGTSASTAQPKKAKRSDYEEIAFRNNDIDKMDKVQNGEKGLNLGSQYTGNVYFDIGLSIGRRLAKKKKNK